MEARRGDGKTVLAVELCVVVVVVVAVAVAVVDVRREGDVWWWMRSAN